ncbi:hypothetical protein KAFR_0E00340 [Kazachstania africana CBS 2517]|uniref:Peroxisomal ATPase PEX1 n=1 Tax=Kazachstania africana (strain ATCC 22294 / BCRC 22015 / CBS 2517 / CECT 1963 / NBRC 1671 / NRRL Y-8276) TaxID=1071382 RepID=H2AUY8_KAZAF|nr:hypothetical protein KAFR_0E00340 [Kazachstania africana CBS 2517]CCF58188.1 hypothetical protein KAFR_0E00340 [Kazachstania africana CBS 2517]
MNNKHVLTLRLNNDIKGNFIRLPSNLSDMVFMSGINIQFFNFEIDDKWHVSWDGFDSADAGSLEMSPSLALVYKLQHNSTIELEIKKFESENLDDVTVREVYVKPVSSDDWEIAELNASFLQDSILKQTKVVHERGFIVCYIDNLNCKFSIDKMVPESLKVGLLGAGSLIIVEPRENKSRKQRTIRKREIVTKVKRSLCWSKDKELPGVSVGLNFKELVSSFAYISILVNNFDLKRQSKNITKFCQRIAVNAIDLPNLPANHICLSKLAWNSLSLPSTCQYKINNGIKFKIEFTEPPIIHTEANIFIHHYDNKDFANSVLGNMLLTNNMYLQNHNISIELLAINGKHIPAIDLSQVDPKNITYSHIKESEQIKPKFDIEEQETHEYVDINENIAEIIKYITLPILPSTGLLIEGSSGQGKTTTLRRINSILRTEYNYHTIYLNCEEIAEFNNFEKMKSLIDEWASVFIWYKPMCLILDNSEFLFNEIISEDKSKKNKANSFKLANYLISVLTNNDRHVIDNNRIIFSSSNRNSISKLFYDRHFIDKIWSLKAPSKTERRKIVDWYLKRFHVPTDDDDTINDIVMETEGYSISDIKTLSYKLLNAYQINHRLNKREILEIIGNFTPTSLQRVKLSNNAKKKVKWEDIGGLVMAKNVLLETLEWPTKYQPVFQNCPLRLRSGILLYGYPGCGKTLLANAVASQCGLNFISIKGPEILNKYIGASEQNVRELFEKAESIKPCVLFFDEFDSIATKRGHDSTGVTDRVVNQLLTEMDGAEGLSGVYVLAATSRPDLIDPALLRPGRLDKSIICDIPNEMDRYDILDCVLFKGKLQFAGAVEDLKQIATMTQGYSGADLQGLCYSAHLKAVHRQLATERVQLTTGGEETNDIEVSVINELTKREQIIENVKERLDKKNGQENSNIATTTRGNAKTELVVSMQDLLEAVQETRPSISQQESQKLRKIYDLFQNNTREGTLPSTEVNPTDVGNRISLM